MAFFLQVMLPIFSIAIGLAISWFGGKWVFRWMDRVIRDPGGILLAWLLNIMAWLAIAGVIAFYLWYGILLAVTYPYGSLPV